MSDQPAPAFFRAAVQSLRDARPRTEITLAEIPAPQRLAPYTFAMSAEVDSGTADETTGRLVLLHDPDGQDSWDGVLRLVTFVSAELEQAMAADPLLAAVGWSWLVEALEANGADYTAAGGTVTQTTSTRFGDLAGPGTTCEVELRASWTALDADLGPHLLAWCELLSSSAGLPPPGVSTLGPRRTTSEDVSPGPVRSGPGGGSPLTRHRR